MTDSIYTEISTAEVYLDGMGEYITHESDGVPFELTLERLNIGDGFILRESLQQLIGAETVE